MRRAVAIILVTLLCGSAATSQENTLPPRLDSSISRGLDFLQRRQVDDGAFEAAGLRVQSTSLALTAFLSAGHTPGVGQYGSTVRNAIDFLLAQAPKDGYFGAADQSEMYGHAMATLALSQAAGVEPDAKKRRRMDEVLRKAVKVILDAQSVKKEEPHAGGWGGTPAAADSELSLTVWNLLALRAARDAAIDVPGESLENAKSFVLRCYNEKEKQFAYAPGGDVSVGATASGLLCLQLLDDVEGEPAKAALESLAKNSTEGRHVYYAFFVIVQASHRGGDAAWPAIGPGALDRLIKLQNRDGGFPRSRSSREPGRIYATAVAVMTLATPYRLLPAFEPH